jgi:eukaryotic-like serine/threonine-protein kinase
MFFGHDHPTSDKPISCGRYELIERIGMGGMAEVFRARLPGPNGFAKTVVVKRILPRLLDDKLVLQMFIEEAKIAAAADHDNIAKVFELGRNDDGRYFMVMEYLAGIDMELLLRGAAQRSLRVPIWFAMQVMSEVLEALSFVHSLVDDEGRPRNVIHRDVTPSNIFVTYLGRVKLSDFGIADFAGKTPTTQAGQLKGKISYMSPEQLNARMIDQRSDLFTAGVVLWEVLTQQRLFGKLNEVQAMMAICDGARRAPSELEPAIPPELDRITLKALAADRDERYSTAAEFQSDLLDCLHAIRGPVRQSDMQHVVQVLLGREEPDRETLHMASTSSVAPDPNASFLLKLDEEERDQLKEQRRRSLAERASADESMLDETFQKLEASEDATIPMRAIDLRREFWVKSPGAAAVGPMPYEAAREKLVEAANDDAPIAISADGKHWMELQQFSELSGQDFAIDASATATTMTLAGSLEQRSMAALFGLIARDRPDGTLSVANLETEQWYEIHVAAGKPVGVSTNVPSMQMPALLVAKKVMHPTDIVRWLHAIVRSGKPGAEAALAEGLTGLEREVFLRERMTALFKWEKAEYTFQRTQAPRAGAPFAASLLAMLPGLIEAAVPEAELRRRLAERIEKRLEPSWRFADAVEEMALPAAERSIVDGLQRGESIAKVIEAQPSNAKRVLGVAYVMLEADLLLVAIEE